jgi:hypothetical protein
MTNERLQPGYFPTQDIFLNCLLARNKWERTIHAKQILLVYPLIDKTPLELESSLNDRWEALDSYEILKNDLRTIIFLQRKKKFNIVEPENAMVCS